MERYEQLNKSTENKYQRNKNIKIIQIQESDMKPDHITHLVTEAVPMGKRGWDPLSPNNCI